MRVDVISDMEGVAGIVEGGADDRRQAALRGGTKSTRRRSTPPFGGPASGATEIVVMDCHGAGKGWTFDSLIPEDLTLPASSSSRTSGRSTRSSSSRVATRRFRRHARASRNAGRRHEPHDLREDYQNLWFNGTLVGETGINAALCGTWGCPC